MATSRALLEIKYQKSRCILCNNAVHKVTIGNLCNSCKDGFAASFGKMDLRPMAM